MPILSLPSPHKIFIAGAVVAIVMAWAGFHLGAPPPHLHAALPVTGSFHAQNTFKSSKTVATTNRTSASFSRSEVPLTPIREQTLVKNEPVFNANAKDFPSESGQDSSRISKAAIVSKPPRHPLTLAPNWPLIMKAVDFQTIGFSPQQQAVVQQLQEQFVKDIGGTNQDPANPAYGKRWLTAAQIADEQLRAKIGWEAFNAYTIAAFMTKNAP